ncbi:MAG: heparan-alpha-glucosaminide N-acetyltransferase domain-containing protein [Rubricoccaceae bacterium]
MKRVIGYDIARALAVVGMVIVNFKIAMGAEQNGPAWLQQLVGLLDGRAAATFVVLAGVGLSLLSKKGREAQDRERLGRDRNILLKRALFLFVIGLLYTPIWPADILHFYGAYIAVAAFLLAAPTRRLWALAGSLVVGFVVLFIVLDYETGWDWSTLEYSGFWTPAGLVRHLFYNGFHPVVPWLAFMLVGMVLGRQDLTGASVRRRVIVWGASVALVAEAVSFGLVRVLSVGASPSDLGDITALFGTAPMPPLPLYMLAGAGTACAIIGLAVSLGERYPEARWLRPLVATGQLALTLYVAHVIVGMGTLEAMGRFENQTLGVSLAASGIFCTVGVAFAHLWRMRFKRGPLEAIMRAVTDPRTSR